MLLTTGRLLLRPFEARDLDDLHAYRSQEGVGEAAGWPHHTTLAQSREVLDFYLLHPDFLAVVDRRTSRVLGHLGIQEDSEDGLPDVRELGCALRREAQGRGLMSEAIRAVLPPLFDAGMREVWACCFEGNEPSRRLIERCGFAFVRCGSYEAKKLGRTFPSREYVWTRERWLRESDKRTTQPPSGSDGGCVCFGRGRKPLCRVAVCLQRDGAADHFPAALN